MRKTLDAKYDHNTVEQEHYKTWVENGYFTAGDKSKDPFCVVIPPPNVTGKLHLGHAWDTTLQDIVARYKRLGAMICYGFREWIMQELRHRQKLMHV